MNTKTQLRKAYTRRLNSLNKNFFKDQNSGLNIFVEYLRFKRDNLILDNTNKNALTTLVVAIKEFEAYQTTEDTKQKSFHWNNFCTFVRLNMEDWQTLDDSV